MIRLYSFFNSSTAYRVRIALALKALDYETIAVNIRAGAHREASYLGPINASAAVPVLEIDGLQISQSLAIIDYLDARFPTPKLIPHEPAERASVQGLAMLIASDMHPLNNLRVLQYLQNELEISAARKDAWYAHWIKEGFESAERVLKTRPGGPFCFGEQPNLADCCLIPQVANAMRMKCDLSPYPTVLEIYRHAMTIPAFQQAAPERQPDYIA